MAKTIISDVGVIVGRFQVPELHKGHTELIESVCLKHQRVLIFLGISPLKSTFNNPLDFEARKQMLLEKFPDVNVLYIKDNFSDIEWSKKLDEQITDVIGPNQTVTLYGSRDSFLEHYFGKFHKEELIQKQYISGTEIRKNISIKAKSSSDFRTGVIFATSNQFPKVYPTVDIAILDSKISRLLLAKKHHREKYQFVGGYADPKSSSFEHDALRELAEETGINANYSFPKYIGSSIIEDWRYSREVDKIKTLLFKVYWLWGDPIPDGDELIELVWFDCASENDWKNIENNLENLHKPLLTILKENLK